MLMDILFLGLRSSVQQPAASQQGQHVQGMSVHRPQWLLEQAGSRLLTTQVLTHHDEPTRTP
jgi:hypothetical protein